MSIYRSVIYSLTIVFLTFSCVSVNRYEDLLFENKQLQRNEADFKNVLNEIETLKFKTFISLKIIYVLLIKFINSLISFLMKLKNNLKNIILAVTKRIL